ALQHQTAGGHLLGHEIQNKLVVGLLARRKRGQTTTGKTRRSQNSALHNQNWASLLFPLQLLDNLWVKGHGFEHSWAHSEVRRYAFHLLLMLITAKKPRCLYGFAFVLQIAQAILLQFLAGKWRSIERVEGNAPCTG